MFGPSRADDHGVTINICRDSQSKDKQGSIRSKYNNAREYFKLVCIVKKEGKKGLTDFGVCIGAFFPGITFEFEPVLIKGFESL